MKVTTAKTAGFCFGVRRAVETVYEQVANSSEPVYTFGPIIHNEQVVKDLESRGVKVIHSEAELKRIAKGTVVIRSHGVPRSVCQAAQEQGHKVVDATCPFVKKIHRIVEEESRMGHQIIIIGNPSHPEVEGIKGWCHTPATVISTEEEARKFTPNPASTLCIVSQTTFNYNKFQDLVEILAKKRYDKRNVFKYNLQCHPRAAAGSCQTGGAGGCHDCHRRQKTAPTRRNCMKYAKKNVQILTIYRHSLIWKPSLFNLSVM